MCYILIGILKNIKTWWRIYASVNWASIDQGIVWSHIHHSFFCWTDVVCQLELTHCPGRFEYNLRLKNIKLILMICGGCTFCGIALQRMLFNLTDDRCQAIIWTSAGILLIRILGTDSEKSYYHLDPWEETSVIFFYRNTKFFIHGNAFENIVCEMAAILSRRDELSTGPFHRWR